MRIAICNEVLASLPFERQCEFARQVGYDGLEIAPFTLGEDAHSLPRDRRAAIRRAAADAGIRISGLHMLLYRPEGLSITTADRIVRDRTIEVMRRLIGLAVDLGARILVHGSPMARRLAPGDADGRKRGIDAFAAISAAAREARVTYCIEPLAKDETVFLNTVEEAAEVVAAIGDSAVQTMIDCSAAGRVEREPVADVIRRWVPRGIIAHIHFNDPNRRGPGEGKLEFAPIIRAIADSRYTGDAAVEPFIYEPDGPTCAARQIGYLRGLMETVRFVGKS